MTIRSEHRRNQHKILVPRGFEPSTSHMPTKRRTNRPRLPQLDLHNRLCFMLYITLHRFNSRPAKLSHTCILTWKQDDYLSMMSNSTPLYPFVELFPLMIRVLLLFISRLHYYRDSYPSEFFRGLRCGYLLLLYEIWAWSVY